MKDFKSLGRDALVGEACKLDMQNAALRAKVAARDELIEKLSRSVDACIEQGASTLRRVADYGKRWALDAAYGTQEIANVTIDKVIPEYEAPPNGWQTFNNYLHKAREHGKHDYQKGRTCNPSQYCKPELQDAYKSGYESEHERAGGLS